MAISVQNKVAIVTGSTKGIGLGIAQALAQSGANIVVVSRHQTDCDAVAAELSSKYGIDTIGIAADLRSIEKIEEMVQKAVSRFGHIDILVNNAGSGLAKPAEDVTEEDWEHVISLDLKSVFFCSQIVGRQMIQQKSGKIINIASALGIIVGKMFVPYMIAKAGVLHMTRGLAAEWAKHNIQVNAICPGYVRTGMTEISAADESIKSSLLRKFPMRRFGEVDEIAQAAVYLGSDASNYMTGQAMVIDGGWCVGQ